jgi:hypothetical protein
MKTFIRASALALAVATGAPTAPAAAQDRQIAPAKRTIPSVRMLGKWSRNCDYLTISETSGVIRLEGFINPGCTQTPRKVAMTLTPYAPQGYMEGKWQEFVGGGTLRFEYLPGENGWGPKLKVTQLPGGTGSYIPNGEYSGRVSWDAPGSVPRFAGKWNVQGGSITFRMEGDKLAGEFVRSGEPPEVIQRFLFSGAIADATGRLQGAWSEASNDSGAEASLEWSADGERIYLRYPKYGMDKAEVLTRAKDQPGGMAAGPRIVQGSAARKPGYIYCGGWCEFKIVASETRVNNLFGSGPSPAQYLTVHVHNTSAETKTVKGDNGNGDVTADMLRFAWVRSTTGATINYANAIGPARAPRVAGVADVMEFYPFSAIDIPAGAEAELTYVAYWMPDGADELHFKPGGSALIKTAAKPWTCSFLKKQKELFDAHQLAMGYSHLDPAPAFCDQLTPADDPLKTAAAAGAGGSSGNPGMSEAPATSGAPGIGGSGMGSDGGYASSGSQSSAGQAAGSGAVWSMPGGESRPGQSNADGFTTLLKYGVKLEEVNDRGDGRYEVIAAVKNRTGAPLYFTSGQLMVYAEDRDGIGQQASQPWRASVEPPAVFGATPVIQPGATLRARWFFHAEPKNALVKVTFSEGSKRVDFTP